METTLIVKTIEGRFYRWFELIVRDDSLISKREIGDESEKVRKNIDKKYFKVNNPEVLSKLQFLCERGSSNCINNVYIVGNERKRTLSEAYSLGKPMDEPSLKRRAMADGNNNKKKKKRSVKKDGCWKGYERVPGTVQYSKGSCRKKNKKVEKKLFDGLDFKKLMRGE